MDLDDVLTFLAALADAEVEYALVGAVALNLHGLARATADIDIFVSPAPDNVARLRQALFAVFNDPAIAEITASDLGGDYPVIQYIPPKSNFHIDILARLGDAYYFKDIECVHRNVEGVPVRVATPRMLFRMKKNTIRLQDRADAERLRRRFHLEED